MIVRDKLWRDVASYKSILAYFLYPAGLHRQLKGYKSVKFLQKKS